jgi:hypothetical protein
MKTAFSRIEIICITVFMLIIALSIGYRFQMIPFSPHTIWADRDLVRALNVWVEWPFTGPELLLGGRLPGGAYYYLLSILETISSGINGILIWINIIFAFSGVIVFVYALRQFSLIAAFGSLAIYTGGLSNIFLATKQLWNPSVTPLFYTISTLLIFKIFVEKKPNYFPILFFLASLSGQFHIVSYAIIPVTLLMAGLFRIKLGWPLLGASFICGLLPLAPFLYGQITNDFADITGMFQGIYERTQYFNYQSTTPSFGEMLNTRVAWFGTVLAEILGIQRIQTPLWHVFDAFPAKFNLLVSFAMTLFVFSLFCLNIFLFFRKKLVSSSRPPSTTHSAFDLYCFRNSVLITFFISVLFFGAVENIIPLKYIFFNKVNFILLFVAFPMMVLAANYYALNFSTSRNQKNKNEILTSIDLSNKEYITIKVIFAFLLISVVVLLLFSSNIAPRYLTWLLPAVALGGGIAIDKLVIGSRSLFGEKISSLFVIFLLIWMVSHSWINSTINSAKHDGYQTFYNILKTAKRDFKLDTQGLNNKILFVDYSKEMKKFHSKDFGISAASYIIQDLDSLKVNDPYSGCLAILDNGLDYNNVNYERGITAKNFRSHLINSIDKQSRGVFGKGMSISVDWITDLGRFMYVGYQLETRNCFKTINNSYILTDEEKVIEKHSTGLDLNSAKMIWSDDQKYQYVGSISGLMHWPPITFLIDLASTHGKIEARLHSRSLRGYNGIIAYALVNPTLTLTRLNGDEATIKIPILSGTIGNVPSATKPLIYPPWGSLPVSVPAGQYRVGLVGDNVIVQNGHKSVTRPEQPPLGPFSVVLADRLDIK